MILLLAAAGCTAIGFAVGRNTSSRELFYIIGTPVGPSDNRNAPVADARRHTAADEPKRLEQLVATPGAGETSCGAPTNSGRPCQRKVKDGGYCWQHRLKFGDKKFLKPAR